VLLTFRRRAIAMPLLGCALQILIVPVWWWLNTGPTPIGPSPLRVQIFCLLAWLGYGAYQCVWTVVLCVRGDRLRVATLYRRSSLDLAKCTLRSDAEFGKYGRGVTIRISDGETAREITAYRSQSRADLAMRRLERDVLARASDPKTN
jgi:hypothetical protein